MKIKKQIKQLIIFKTVALYLFINLITLVNTTFYAANYTNVNEILVSNLAELNSAILSAKPGDIIVMKDGIWHDAVINFNSIANSSAKITLRAQTAGNVILDGSSMITFSKPYLIVDGLFFKNGAISKNSVINFNSDYCQLTNTAIVDYNPAEFETKYYWVYFQGNYNQVDHCYFKGKNHQNPLMGNDNDNSRHNQVDHCYIKDITYVPKANGREILRIWGYGHADEMDNDGAYFTIEYNLFEQAHGEGTEIISLKSNYNIVRYNTIKASRGGIVGRRGKNNVIEGNYIFGENLKGTCGIRVAGPNHRVINNYVADVAEDGLRLIAGEYIEKSLTSDFKVAKKKPLPKYIQVIDGYYAHNTIINAGGHGIDIGYNYKNHWPEIQMVLLPENNRFVNNLVYKCKENTINIALQDKNSPLDLFTFKPNFFENNITYGGRIEITPLPSGIKIIDPLLKLDKDGIYRAKSNSPIINSGATSDVKDDIEGKVRDDKKDIGADELSQTKSIHHPLTPSEVGPQWIITKRKAGEKY